MNPYHDPSNGQFTEGPGGSSASATKQQKKYYKLASNVRALATEHEYSSKDSGAKRFAKIIAIGGTGNRQTYNMARAAGESRAKAFLRAKFDLNLPALLNGATHLGFAKIGQQMVANLGVGGRLVGRAGAVAGYSVDKLTNEALRKHGRVSSLQQQRLRNKYYTVKPDEQ